MFGHARENVSAVSYEFKTEQWVWATWERRKIVSSLIDRLVGVIKSGRLLFVIKGRKILILTGICTKN